MLALTIFHGHKVFSLFNDKEEKLKSVISRLRKAKRIMEKNNELAIFKKGQNLGEMR